MQDYENMILAQQEQLDIMDESDGQDDCSKCRYLNQCRRAAEGQGDWPQCPQ